MMFRRVLALLLIVQLLLTQMARCHCHVGPCAGDGKAGPTPHVHVSSLPFAKAGCESDHGHSHGHGHSHHGHSHHHGTEADADGQAAAFLMEEAPGQDHDSDAVYLPDSPLLDRAASRVLSLLFGWEFALPPSFELASVPTVPALLAQPPPSAYPPDPPLYLLNLTLLV